MPATGGIVCAVNADCRCAGDGADAAGTLRPMLWSMVLRTVDETLVTCFPPCLPPRLCQGQKYAIAITLVLLGLLQAIFILLMPLLVFSLCRIMAPPFEHRFRCTIVPTTSTRMRMFSRTSQQKYLCPHKHCCDGICGPWRRRQLDHDDDDR